jgi:glyoxylase-like metal-dependent hydrolase (beta-lactamase superfamily II)
MERLTVGSAVISLLFLISWPSVFPGGQQGFSIKVFTSPDDQFWTNSVIIEGANEVMLVDAQLTKTSAERVLQQIKETKKPLSIIYITHEHADHFLGLEVFREAYPRVRIIANSAVVDRINKVYQDKIDKWENILGSGATSHVVAIDKFDGDFIKFEGSEIEVLKPSKATPIKTRCFGFPDREFSLQATFCSMTCMSTLRKRTVTLEQNG